MLPLDIQEPKMIKVSKEGVTILSDELKKKINRKNLSPTMINAFHTSPGEWVMSAMIEPIVSLEEPIYFARGSWFHSVMEEFFKHEDRNLDKLKEAFTTATKENESYYELSKDEENREWIGRCIKGFKMLAEKTDFEKQKVANVFYNGKQSSGIELYVGEYLEGIENRCGGFIDCLFEEEGGLRIVDWKTGKHYAGDPGYELQQTFYALLLEKAGFSVNSACLVFPIGKANTPVIEEIKIHDEEVRQKVLQKAKIVDKEFNKAKETGFFPFRRHFFNSWQTYLTGNGKARKPKIDEDKFFEIADLTELQ